MRWLAFFCVLWWGVSEVRAGAFIGSRTPIAVTLNLPGLKPKVIEGSILSLNAPKIFWEVPIVIASFLSREGNSLLIGQWMKKHFPPGTSHWFNVFLKESTRMPDDSGIIVEVDLQEVQSRRDGELVTSFLVDIPAGWGCCA